MRLLDTETCQFVWADPERTEYAILSHTWDRKGEQTYEELRSIQQRYGSRTTSPATRMSASWFMRRLIRLRAAPNHTPNSSHAPSSASNWWSTMTASSIWDDPELSPKIREACRIARENGYRYIWIDSCCIDKSSSSELSEAINSMYKWFSLAAVCYVYLADVPPGENHEAKDSAFRKSRWFGRGWTLQELIAPTVVEFLTQDWVPIGSKHALISLLESVTKIDYKALLHLEPLDAFSVAQRFSWAANRMTTRVEDQAYSLLGLFGINMTTLYGEGDRAFRRLQEQIMQRIPDQSLFAWGHLPSSQLPLEVMGALGGKVFSLPSFQHLVAVSPSFFWACEGITTSRPNAVWLPSSHNHTSSYTPTPYGICTQFPMVALTRDLLLCALPDSNPDVQLDLSESPEGAQWYLAVLGCQHLEYTGHQLARVCYTIPFQQSDVEFVYGGCVYVGPQQLGDSQQPFLNLFLLSLETLKRCRPHTELKTVYIPHPNPATLPATSWIQHRPYRVIKLLLLKGTLDALRSRGYSVDLRHPDPDHPTTHWLTLSNDEHTITAEFQHTLENSGRRFTIVAEVKMSGSFVQLDSAPRSEQVNRRTVSWSDMTPWNTELDHQKVRLNGAGDRPLTVDLGLDVGGTGVYILRVDVVSDGLAVTGVDYDYAGGGKAKQAEFTEGSSRSTINTGDGVGRKVEAEAGMD